MAPELRLPLRELQPPPVLREGELQRRLLRDLAAELRQHVGEQPPRGGVPAGDPRAHPVKPVRGLPQQLGQVHDPDAAHVHAVAEPVRPRAGELPA